MRNAIIAKFTCQSALLTPRGHDPKSDEVPDKQYFSEQIKLSAIYEEEGPNKDWARWTPSGSLEMTIDNPGAQGIIRPGDVVMVTLAPDPRNQSAD